jgi:hypothetical protein
VTEHLTGDGFLSKRALQRGQTDQIYREPRQREHTRPRTTHGSPLRNTYRREQQDTPLGDYDYYFPSQEDAIESGKEESHRRHREPKHHHRDPRIRTARDERPQERNSRNNRRPKSHNGVANDDRRDNRRHSRERIHRERPHSSTRRKDKERNLRQEEDFDQLEAQNTDDDFPYRHYDDADDREVVQSPDERRHRRRSGSPGDRRPRRPAADTAVEDRWPRQELTSTRHVQERKPVMSNGHENDQPSSSKPALRGRRTDSYSHDDHQNVREIDNPVMVADQLSAFHPVSDSGRNDMRQQLSARERAPPVSNQHRVENPTPRQQSARGNADSTPGQEIVKEPVPRSASRDGVEGEVALASSRRPSSESRQEKRSNSFQRQELPPLAENREQSAPAPQLAQPALSSAPPSRRPSAAQQEIDYVGGISRGASRDNQVAVSVREDTPAVDNRPSEQQQEHSAEFVQTHEPPHAAMAETGADSRATAAQVDNNRHRRGNFSVNRPAVDEVPPVQAAGESMNDRTILTQQRQEIVGRADRQAVTGSPERDGGVSDGEKSQQSSRPRRYGIMI